MEFIIKRNGTIKGGDIIKNKKTGELKVIQNKKKYFVKDLVYQKYSGEEIDENQTIIHIDGDKENNNFENLKCVEKETQTKNKMIKMRTNRLQNNNEKFKCDNQIFTSKYALSKHLNCSAGLIQLIIAKKAKNKRQTFTHIVDNKETVFKPE